MMNVKPGIICLYHHRVRPRRAPMGSRDQVHLHPLARAMQALRLETHCNNKYEYKSTRIRVNTRVLLQQVNTRVLLQQVNTRVLLQQVKS
jgi:hypothetical protein